MPSRSESSGSHLGHYRAKRRASATPEPFGEGELAPAPKGVGSRRLFVVQQHAATNLHWDFRLEVDNVLRSWAVPKGPSLNPEDKRFAALVEDHPLDYAHFEGAIPEGNYGAGNVIVWDQGTYTELEDFDVGFPKGKLLFELHGHKLHGRWTLIRLKGRENTGKEWLLIKERDGHEDDARPADDSVLSGLTIETLAQPEALQTRLHRRLKRITPKLPETASLTEEPMLAKASEPFRRKGWVYEIKYDGYRLLIERDGDFVTLRSRRGVDLTERFPEIARSAERLPYDEFAIDGEVVVTDERGVPSFSRLQERASLRGELAIRRASNHDPVRYYAFDLLHAVGLDLKSLPLVKRKQLLRDMLPSAGPIRYSEHVEGDGVQTFEAMVKPRSRRGGGQARRFALSWRAQRRLAEGAGATHFRIRDCRLGAGEVEPRRRGRPGGGRVSRRCTGVLRRHRLGLQWRHQTGTEAPTRGTEAGATDDGHAIAARVPLGGTGVGV